MAEGDTILRTARRIELALRDERVEVSSPNPRGHLAGLRRLNGRKLTSAEAMGKHLLLGFGDLALHSHLGMNGSWHLYSHGERWRRPRAAAWAVLGGERWEAAQFGGPILEVMPATRLRAKLAGLGPDILGPAFDPTATARSLRTAPDRGLGDALLDQSLVAGIGNIFKSEACFGARVDPWREVGGLSVPELESVLTAARGLMQEAVESGRRSNAVYRRAGRGCHNCGTPILSSGQGDANRLTYWCPNCQGYGGGR